MSMAKSGLSAKGNGVGLQIPLEGNLNLREASQLCSKLCTALEGFDSLEIDIAGLTGIDISIVQLLLAARKSAVRRGKTFSLSGTPTEPVRTFLAGVGLMGREKADESFWLGRANAERAA